MSYMMDIPPAFTDDPVQPVFGPTMGDEIIAAGLGGLPFSWLSSGEIYGRESLTAEQNATLDGVIAAHDPTMQREA